MIRPLRIACLICAFLIVGFSILRWGGWCRVREVRVPPTRYVAVEQLTGFLLGANVLRLELWTLHMAIRSDPRVLSATIKVCPLAQRVELEIEERKPAVQVQLRGGRAVWTDADGVILEPAAEAAVIGVENRGDRVEREVVAAAQAVARLSPVLRARFPVFDVSNPNCVTARGAGGPTLLCGPIGQLADRLAILEKLWEMGVLSGYTTVDLRVHGEVILKRKG